MKKDEWFGLKASLCDAFAALQYAQDKPMKEADVDNCKILLTVLNDYLEKDFPDD